MLLSMTGYGKAAGNYKGKSYIIDIKTLNGKVSDLRLKAPAFLRSREVEMRKSIMSRVLRGKMDCTISIEDSEDVSDYIINLPLMESYLKQLSSLSDRHNLQNQDLLQTVIRIPNVVQANNIEVEEDEWHFILSLIDETIERLNEFRRNEGESLQKDLMKRVNNIESLLAGVPPLEEQRNRELKEKLRRSINENIQEESIDQNRLEQEILYYLEKLDIHEEKVRLKQHCEFFRESTQNKTIETGKKINFISQEMGREINTLGSKAQYSPLQKIVVAMKVELDQIKEQIANVL